LVQPAAATRARAVSRIAAFMSTPTTRPLGPTRSAASSATSPAPLPMSSTFMPGPMPAAWKKRRVIGP
jgi:hypothetical protein